MEPVIQYATTSDGVSIAFWDIGQGMPLVVMPSGSWSTIQLERQVPRWLHLLERLTPPQRLILYDIRGTGLSYQTGTDFGLEYQLRDLEAVVDRLELDRFALLAPRHSGPVGISYASSNPDRLSCLILWCSYARGSDHFEPRQSQAIRSLMDQDWDLYLETVSHARLGWSDGDTAHRLAKLIEESASREMIEAFHVAAHDTDVSSLMSDVSSPTLVLHRRGLPYPDVNTARNLAAGIPNARLILLDGDSATPVVGDSDAPLNVINEFLNEGVDINASTQSIPKATELFHEPLSPRELEVLRLIATGLSNQEVADELVIAVGTIKTHVNSIYRKLDARNRTHALVRAAELDLL